MFKNINTLISIVAIISCTYSSFAQDSWVPAAYQYFQENDANFNLKVSDFNNPIVTDEYSSRGNSYTYYNQQWNGIPIFGRSMTVASRDELLLYASHNYTSLEDYSKPNFNHNINGDEILVQLAPIAGLAYDGDFEQSEAHNEFNIRGYSSISPEKIYIEKAYVEVENQLVPAWLEFFIMIFPNGGSINLTQIMGH